MLSDGAKRAEQYSWRRATFCQSGECAEVSQGDGMILMRNSRDPSGQVLRYTPEEWQALVRGIKAGEFDDFGA
jgi:uncharacterized protein DUF397